MNKALVFAVGASITFALAGCSSGGTASSSTSSDSSASTSQTVTETTAKDFDGSTYSDMGSGTAFVYTQAGTGENGNVPKITLPSDTIISQVEVDTKGLDATHVTYVYVDGTYETKGNFAQAQMTVNLKGDLLKAGTHTVEVVQFDTDDPSGKVILYKKSQFEIAN